MSIDPMAGRASPAELTLLGAFRLAVPDAAIEAAIILPKCAGQRQRLLSARLMVSLVIALSVWSRDAARQVLANLVDRIKELGGDFARWHLAQKSAITMARQRLGSAARMPRFG